MHLIIPKRTTLHYKDLFILISDVRRIVARSTSYQSPSPRRTTIHCPTTSSGVYFKANLRLPCA